MKGPIIQGCSRRGIKKVDVSLGKELRKRNELERHKRINKEISKLLEGY